MEPDRKMYTVLYSGALLMGMVLGLIGCRRAPRHVLTPKEAHLQITLQVEPDPPRVGPATLILTVTDAQGRPVPVQEIRIKGDMTHPGMIPVTGQHPVRQPQRVYRLPFEWTMQGDWLIKVQLQLQDGRVIAYTFFGRVDGKTSWGMQKAP